MQLLLLFRCKIMKHTLLIFPVVLLLLIGCTQKQVKENLLADEVLPIGFSSLSGNKTFNLSRLNKIDSAMNHNIN